MAHIFCKAQIKDYPFWKDARLPFPRPCLFLKLFPSLPLQGTLSAWAIIFTTPWLKPPRPNTRQADVPSFLYQNIHSILVGPGCGYICTLMELDKWSHCPSPGQEASSSTLVRRSPWEKQYDTAGLFVVLPLHCLRKSRPYRFIGSYSYLNSSSCLWNIQLQAFKSTHYW